MALSDFFKKKNAVKVGTPLKPMGDFPLVDAHDVIVDYDETTGVETRLDEKLGNISTGGVELDTTLSRTGMAADAGAVGEILGDIHTILKNI